MARCGYVVPHKGALTTGDWIFASVHDRSASQVAPGEFADFSTTMPPHNILRGCAWQRGEKDGANSTLPTPLAYRWITRAFTCLRLRWLPLQNARIVIDMEPPGEMI